MLYNCFDTIIKLNNMNKPLIVVTNDDSIYSNGIKVLVEIAKSIGEVVIVAPDKPQSGMGHAITIGEVLRLEKSTIFEGLQAYTCSGTPADCVKFAKNHVLKDRKIDLVLSGVNHGSNASISVIYSGTMSAAIEGAVDGLPSIGFSVCDYLVDAEIDHIIPFAKMIINNVLRDGMTKGVALNVNFPAKSDIPIKGIKVVRQAKASWEEVFEERKTPHGQPYYWLGGDFKSDDIVEGTDIWAIERNYVSIVPCQFDLTMYSALNELKGLEC